MSSEIDPPLVCVCGEMRHPVVIGTGGRVFCDNPECHNGVQKATEAQVKKLVVLMNMHMIDRDKFKKAVGVQSTKELSREQISRYIDHYENLPLINL